MKCRYCGNELRSGERFCRKCGKPAEAEPVQSPRFCIECGAELLPNAGFCRSCGAPVSQQKPEQPQQPNAAQTDEKAELKRRTEILVIAAQGGDSESFAKLYELYHQKVFALAKTTVKSDADAEDVLQMTFIKAWDHLDRLKDTSAFSTWIQRITLNQCYSLLRKQHATIPIDNDDEDSEPIQIESDLMLPEVYAEQNDLKKRLGKIIDELSDIQKQTITLYYFDGLPVENIAWIMDCSVNTVKSRLFLARKSIKTEIEEQERKSGQPFYGIVGLATIPFGQFFVAHVKASSLSQTAASALLKAIAGKISQSASAAAKAGSSAAVKAGTSAAAKGAANAGAKTAAAAGTKAAAGAGAKTAAAVGASVSKKVIAGIVAGTLAVGTVAGGTVATVKIVQNNRERKAAESATTVVTDGTFPSVTASDPFLPQDPSDGLSAQEREAYRAYLDCLIENKAGIDNYIWQKGYLYLEEGNYSINFLNDNTLSRPVALCDICGDALPELIYVGDVEPGYFDNDGLYANDSSANLHILTVRDGKAVTLYNEEIQAWGVGDPAVPYSLFQTNNEKALYGYQVYDQGGTQKLFWRLEETDDGRLIRKSVAELNEVGSDSHYKESGNPVSKQRYAEIESDLQSKTERVLICSDYPLFLPKSTSVPCLAKTCGEMLAYFRGRLDSTVENAALAEPYRAYLDVLFANKASIKTYQFYPGDFGVDFIFEPDHLQRAVVLYDLDRDGIPELLYIRDLGEPVDREIELDILTYRNGKAEIVFVKQNLIGDNGNFAIFRLRNDPELYINYREDDIYQGHTGTYSLLYFNDYYTLSDSNGESADPFLSDSEEYDADSGNYVHVFRSNGETIDKAAFDAKERELLDRKEDCLILGWGMKNRTPYLAMTCDEQITYLTAFLETVPAQPPVAPETSSEGTELVEVYRAYLKHLEQNRSGIDNYKNVFDYPYDNSTDPENYPMPRAVALFDVCGDAIPELIYINEGRKDAQFGTIYNLNVLTYRDGSLVSVYRDEWDYNSYWDEMITYYLFADPTSKTMYFFEDSSMSEYVLKEYSAFTETASGHLQRSRIMFHEEEYDEDSEKTTVVYNVNGKNVSEADFRKEVERLQANAVYLIPRPGEFREPENAQYIAMTCDEMIAYLKGLLDG